jgi:imidazoleglycerol phosphate dehydratase HisB
MIASPFRALVTGGENLASPPAATEALRERMAAVYGVDASALLVVRGVCHAFELICRLIARDGGRAIAGADAEPLVTLAKIYGLRVTGENAAAAFIASPDLDGEPALTERALNEKKIDAGLLVIDESLIEASDAASLAPVAASRADVVVVRDLSFAHGLAGAPCGALIAHPTLIARIAELVEPYAVPTPITALALSALEPHKLALVQSRLEAFKRERSRVATALRESALVAKVDSGDGPFVFVRFKRRDDAARQMRAFGVRGAWRGETFRLDVGSIAANDAAFAALDAPRGAAPRRVAEVVRETNETRIAAAVDLDRESEIAIDTGVGFFDHMLSQVAAHGGFSVQLSCSGDLHVDPHHTIEDCTLAFGQALAQALGARRGVARFGFVLPMDEAEAKVSIDLGGRPYLVFEGAFSAPTIGAYPTEMTEHVFRSLAQSLSAAIHVSVRGENDHHKTEACFKALGRALRQAIRIEGDRVPSTKGTL